MVKVVESISEWREIFESEIKGKKRLGFVPTMGALHKAHISLVERSIRENDLTVTSIFLNPTQFNDPNDLKNYPKTFDRDRELLEEAGCDYIFLPNREMMYPDDYRYILSETDLSNKFCGAHRPGHFDGVLTVVMKLLNIISADSAYFGEKDWQQYKLIKGMADAFFMQTSIIPCPLIRESDGLAYSSRNALLTKEHRELAPNFYRVLSSGKSIIEMKDELESLGFTIDYIEADENRLLAAVILGEVRLIDNVER